jgi:hypothetical protein
MAITAVKVIECYLLESVSPRYKLVKGFVLLGSGDEDKNGLKRSFGKEQLMNHMAETAKFYPKSKLSLW